jgi:hypothetical protein
MLQGRRRGEDAASRALFEDVTRLTASLRAAFPAAEDLPADLMELAGRLNSSETAYAAVTPSTARAMPQSSVE